MKFDKFMEHCYKIMCIVAACVVAFGSVVSCFNKPLKASAIGGIDGIATFKQLAERNAQTVLDALMHDLNNGSLDATSELAKQLARSVALQILMNRNLANFYDPYFEFENNWDDMPANITISGSGGSAFYKVSGDDNLYPVMVFPVSGGKYPWIAASSEHFNISISLSNYLAQGDFPSVTSYVQYGVNGSTRTGFYFQGSGQNRHIYMSDKSGFFLDWEQQRDGCYFYFSSTSIPTFTQGQRLTFTSTIGGYGVEFDLPSGEVDSDTPWDYYNDYLLPFLIQLFNDYHIDDYDKYLVFPHGYQPSISPDPTEPGTMPSGGISIGSNNNIDIDINVYYPTDELGQPITDESGETVTETEYVTDTTPTDVVYKFTIPTLPNLDRYSDTLPPMNLAQFESGINFIFSAADGIFTDTGFLPVIIVTLSLCALCYVIWKIGG